VDALNVAASQSIYWTEWGNGTNTGSIKKVSTTGDGGGAVVTLATGQSSPMGIGVDGTSVYWVNFGATHVGDPAVMRLTPK
jgi:hypothetical protein